MLPIDALRAYIPIRLQSLVLTPPAPFPFPPWEESFQGAVAFVDLSGFTLLSEALTRQGPKGIERLTEILNNFYQRMVAGVELAGGYVARFSGDALTAELLIMILIHLLRIIQIQSGFSILLFSEIILM